MITIISGVPGSGKTSGVVEMIMDELRAGRKIYTIGIPDLLLKTHKGGDPHTWQNGDWLQIDKYNPDEAKKRGLESPWLPRGCKSSCPYLSTCPRAGVSNPDAGALVIIDEAQMPYPQRASGKAPPPYIEAFAVHRHQGLDFWFISQKPSFLDPFIRGLASRHIHLGLSPFLLFGQRFRYEWPEYQESISRLAKLSASRTKYKPSSNVFPLYKSATVHTKLEQRLPTIVLGLMFAVAVFIGMVGFAYVRMSAYIPKDNAAQPLAVSKPSALPPPVFASSVVAAAPARYSFRFPEVDSCLSSAEYCRCYSRGKRVPMLDTMCRAILDNGYVGAAPTVSDTLSVASN